MSLSQFVAEGEPRWNRVEAWLARMKTRKGRKEGRLGQDPDIDEFPFLFRQICHDLAVARDRFYPLSLTERLNELALRSHHVFYQSRKGPWSRIWSYVGSGFARDLRSEWRLFTFASLLFFGVGLLVFFLTRNDPSFAYYILDAKTAAGAEGMYAEGSDFSRSAQTDTQMFAFYIRNNVGIAFNAYGGGLFFGLVTVFVLLYNGLVLGALFGHVLNYGDSTLFLSFVSGHGPFELTGIVISGVAGLRLGLSLLFPGRRTRVQSIRAAGHKTLGLISGAGVMLSLAAVIEAYWSPRVSLSPEIKYSTGFAMWGIVIAYFLLAGRGFGLGRGFGFRRRGQGRQFQNPGLDSYASDARS